MQGHLNTHKGFHVSAWNSEIRPISTNKILIIQGYWGARFLHTQFLSKKVNHKMEILSLYHICSWLFLLSLGAGWSTLGRWKWVDLLTLSLVPQPVMLPKRLWFCNLFLWYPLKNTSCIFLLFLSVIVLENWRNNFY